MLNSQIFPQSLTLVRVFKYEEAITIKNITQDYIFWLLRTSEIFCFHSFFFFLVKTKINEIPKSLLKLRVKNHLNSCEDTNITWVIPMLFITLVFVSSIKVY